MQNPYEILFKEISLINEKLDLLTRLPKPEVKTEPDIKLSRNEAAEYLGVTLPTLDRYRNDGIIPFYQTGRTIYFWKSQIDAALRVYPSRKKKGAHK